MRSMTKLTATTAGVLAVIALAGCGGADDSDAGGGDFADQSVTEIADAAAEDMKDLDSMRVRADTAGDDGEVSVDVAANVDGDCSGTIETDGVTAEILGAEGAYFLRGDEAFWVGTADTETQGQAAYDAIGDKWVGGESFGEDFASFCDLDEVLDQLDETDENKDTEKGEMTEVDGRDAIALVVHTDDGETGTSWVAAEHEHYVLKMETEGGDKPGTFAFSEFDEPVDAETPDESEIFQQ